MIRMTRFFTLMSTTLTAACCLHALGCAASNDPSRESGTGGTSDTTSSTTAATSTIAASTTTGAANTTATTATTATTVTATGAGAGGATSVSTAAGAGGTTATTTTAGAGGGQAFTPLCAGLMTAANMAPAKNVACTATDPQLCYKTCGPQSIGFKSETCTANLYAEQSGCTFPSDGDYSCYKIPAAIDATCPATPPKASDPCTVAPCTLCNVGGQYLDSSGAMKSGYCVCPAPGANGSKWSCASTTSWPCPGLQGC